MNIDLTMDQESEQEELKGESKSVILVHNGIESNNNLHDFPFIFFHWLKSFVISRDYLLNMFLFFFTIMSQSTLLLSGYVIIV